MQVTTSLAPNSFALFHWHTWPLPTIPNKSNPKLFTNSISKITRNKDLELPIGFSKFRVVPDKLDQAQRTKDAKESCRWWNSKKAVNEVRSYYNCGWTQEGCHSCGLQLPHKELQNQGWRKCLPLHQRDQFLGTLYSPAWYQTHAQSLQAQP